MDDHRRRPADGESTIGLRTAPVVVPEVPPDLGGRYKVSRLVGVGGMGEVWEAEQLEPVRRRVAVKVIKQGMDTREVVARFESERQALAMMDHPAIAKVLDAGVTDRGRPYFVMEHVEGQPIAAFCDSHRLDTRQRLELFMDVCRGVQHAHQKGIIHRDLKPSNVLVSLQDGRPAPRIIDFGIAKALAQPLTEFSMYTHLGQLVGTPVYMSPEQADWSHANVDTRSDIYSLGVMLYELLTGTLPFDQTQLEKASFEDIRRMIREHDPPTPSARISRLGDVAATMANARATSPAKLSGSLRGDLDWIVMRALEKDRSRRYPTANDLVLDIQRHLDDEPVLAGPPDPLYRLRKFVRRHRFSVTASAAMALLLVAGIAGTTVGLLRARTASRRAVREAAASRQIADFLVNLFKESDPAQGRGLRVTARDLLDIGYERVRDKLSDQPQVQARLLYTLGSVYRSLGDRDKAFEALQAALGLRARGDGRRSLEYADTLHELANLRRQMGQYDRAESMLEEVVTIRRAKLGDRDEQVAQALNDLALVYQDARELDRAEPLYDEALAIYRAKTDVDDAAMGETLTNLGALLQLQGRLEEARPLAEEAVRRMRAAHGDDHPYVGYALHNEAWLLHELGDDEGAERASRKALAVFEKAYGDEHFTVGSACNMLARILRAEGKLNEAEAMGRRAVKVSSTGYGPDSPNTARAYYSLGVILDDEGKHAEAVTTLRQAFEILRSGAEPAGQEVISVLEALGQAALSAGDLAAAASADGEVVDAVRHADPVDRVGLGCGLGALGIVRVREGKAGSGEKLLREALQNLEGAKQDPRECRVMATQWLGEALTALGRYDEAERHLLDVHERFSGPVAKNYSEREWTEALASVDSALHKLYAAWGKPDRAAAYRAP